jgi:hypothetical protein
MLQRDTWFSIGNQPTLAGGTAGQGLAQWKMAVIRSSAQQMIVPSRAKSHDPHVAISAFDCCLYRFEMKKAIDERNHQLAEGQSSPVFLAVLLLLSKRRIDCLRTTWHVSQASYYNEEESLDRKERREERGSCVSRHVPSTE